MSKQTIKFSQKLLVFLFEKNIFTYPNLLFEGIIAHITLQYLLSKTLENHKILLRF